MTEVLLLLILLMLKHTIMDFYIQRSFMFSDKHIYGGRGGMVHALSHGVGTFFVLFYFFSPALVVLTSILDAVVHYNVDYAKSKIQQLKRYPTTDTRYWVLFGTDQFLHFLTYVMIVVILFNES